MKKILFTIALCSTLVGCNALDSLLDTTNWTATDTSSFPKTEEDAWQVVNSMYSTMQGFYSDPENCNFYRDMIASDDVYGGGSESSVIAQSTDRLLEQTLDDSQSNWQVSYKGVFRSNYALEAISALDDALFTGDNKNWYLGQAHFMRAFYYWELVEKFETVPLVASTTVENTPRATVDELYEFIAKDLLDAINLMPSSHKYTLSAGDSGRATKYSAEALLARIWMFYTGFYKKESLAGISKTDIINYLKDCRDNSGYGLENDPRELWPCTNDYSSGVAYGTDFDTYASRNNLHWVGNHSKETIFAVHWSLAESMLRNRIAEYCTFRNPAKAPDKYTYPYGIGYANGPVNAKLVEEWYKDPDYGPTDKRLFGSVIVASGAKKAYPWLDEQYMELPGFTGHDSKEAERTWFYQKKYMVVASWSDAAKSSMVANVFHCINGNVQAHNQFGNRGDIIIIRYADVLLMLDELDGTVSGMNALRARAGLQPYSGYSFEKLQKERRYEFAFENVRFNDLRRWYPDQAGQIIDDNQRGGYVEFLGKAVPDGWRDLPGNSIAQRYQKTRGFWAVSQKEINLSNGVLTQTPGFADDDNYQFDNGDLPYYDVK